MRLGAVSMKHRLLPCFSDWIFLAVLGVLLLTPGGPSGLLADGDAGWHIRTGDYILAHGRVPAQDIFSFTRPGESWLAWEWLADVIFALAHRAWGLAGLAVLAALLVALSAAILFRRLLWEGAGVVAAAGLTLLAVSASSVHYLARPHLFTYFLLPIALWEVERDRRNPAPRLWLLVPLAAVWANLHGGFAAWLAMLALETGAALFSDRARARRLALLTGLSLAATLLNPYGVRLHLHIAQYLNAAWIREAVEEFQAPRFRSEAAAMFLALLFAGLISVWRAWERRELGRAANLLFWGQAALHSARHIPVFAMVAAPAVAAAWGGPLRRLFGELEAPPEERCAWPATAALGLLIALGAGEGGFPAARFPVETVERHQQALRHRRVLTSDQWSDYLVYRFPGQKVFLDGRTDFYGRDLAREYASLMLLEAGWRGALDRHRFEVALLPAAWPLAEVLRGDARWRERHRDAQSVLLERLP